LIDSLRRLIGARVSRGIVFYLAFALALSALAGALHWWTSPRTGLKRTFYGQTGFRGSPLLEQVTDEVSLAFLADHPKLPRRSFSIRWRGYWVVRNAKAVEIHAGADDRVDIEVDSRLVLSRDAGAGTQATSRIVLAPGVHEIVIGYQQRRGRRQLNVLWGTPGRRPGEVPRGSFSPDPPGPRALIFAAARSWTTRLAAAAWLIPPATLLLIAAARATPRTVRQLRFTWTRPTLGELRRRLALVAAPALVAPIVLFVLGPYTIYQGNRGEFAVGIAAVLWPWIVAAVALGWAVLFAAGCVVALVSAALTRIYSALLFALGVVLWIQGNVLLADYGPLRGEELDLSVHASRAPYELALWIAAGAAAVVFAGRISSVASRASWLFMAFQMATLGIAALGAATVDSKAEDRQDEPAWSRPPGRIAELSRSRNVIHLVLDGFPSELFVEALQADRAAFDRDFSGFVFFADHLGAFPTTRASMPAMLTGMAYRNEMPFNDFVRRGDRSTFSALAAHGYSVRSITFHSADHPRLARSGTEDIVRYTIPTPYGSYGDYVLSTALQLVDLSLFRHAPHSLKSRVYNDESWLAQGHYARRSLRNEQARRVRTSSNAIFLDELSSRLTATQDAPVYTFIHVGIPHPPIVLDAGCSFIGQTRLRRETYLAQSRCGLAVAARLLNRLRALDIYDKTAVVVSADHGWRVGGRDHPLRGVPSPAGGLDVVAASAMPLLAVKPVGSTGPIRVSTAPTSITDMPATIADLAGLPGGLFPGESVLRIPEGARRPRVYAYHPWGKAGDWSRPYLDVLHLFAINGPVLDPGSWSFQRSLFEPSGAPRALARSETGLYPAGRGPDGSFRFGPPYVVRFAPADARTFAFTARRPPRSSAMQVTVRIDGRIAARHDLVDDAWHTYRHDLGPRRVGGGPFTIELLAAPPWRDAQGRELGVMFRDLEWTR
jgi:hypothetical protein